MSGDLSWINYNALLPHEIKAIEEMVLEITTLRTALAEVVEDLEGIEEATNDPMNKSSISAVWLRCYVQASLARLRSLAAACAVGGGSEGERTR